MPVVPESSAASTIVDLMYDPDIGIGRTRLRLDPVPAPIAAATTDALGSFRAVATGLEPGRYRFVVDYPGSAAVWPARAQAAAAVP